MEALPDDSTLAMTSRTCLMVRRLPGARRARSDDPRYRSVWYSVPNLEAEGKVTAAFREDFQSRSEAEREALFAARASFTDRSKHRDSMHRLIHYAMK